MSNADDAAIIQAEAAGHMASLEDMERLPEGGGKFTRVCFYLALNSLTHAKTMMALGLAPLAAGSIQAAIDNLVQLVKADFRAAEPAASHWSDEEWKAGVTAFYAARFEQFFLPDGTVRPEIRAEYEETDTVDVDEAADNEDDGLAGVGA